MFKHFKKKFRKIRENRALKHHPFFLGLLASSYCNTQSIGQAVLRQGCNPLLLKQINKCTTLSTQFRFFYCRIPKAANSTVMATLGFELNGFTPVSREDMKYVKEKIFDRVLSTNLSRAVVLKDYFKFSVVRNPYSRLVSAFNDKIIDASGYQEHVRKRIVEGCTDSRTVSVIFNDFLDRLETGPLMVSNYHFTPQTTLLAFMPEELDYLGRVENLNEDMCYITKIIFGEPKNIITWAPHGIKTGIKPRSKTLFVDQLTSSQKERILRLYRNDFDLLGYAP